MSKTKEKEKIEVVRINSVSEELDEVFLYREDPYMNKAVYAKPGIYKLGAFTEDTIEKKEELAEEKKK